MLDFGCVRIGGQVKFPNRWGILLDRRLVFGGDE
jgi:hypothetical protein